MVALENIRGRSAARCGQDARRWAAARPSPARLAGARDTQQDERYKVAGQEREPCTPPRRAPGRLRGPESRGLGASGFSAGRGGPNVPGTHGREGEAGPHVLLAGPLGETPGAPPVSMQLPSMAPQAQH